MYRTPTHTLALPSQEGEIVKAEEVTREYLLSVQAELVLQVQHVRPVHANMCIEGGVISAACAPWMNMRSSRGFKRWFGGTSDVCVCGWLPGYVRALPSPGASRCWRKRTR